MHARKSNNPGITRMLPINVTIPNMKIAGLGYLGWLGVTALRVICTVTIIRLHMTSKSSAAMTGPSCTVTEIA